MVPRNTAAAAGAIALFTVQVSGFANPSMNPFGITRISSISCPEVPTHNKHNNPTQTALFMSKDTFIKTDEDDDSVISFIDMSSEGEKAIDCYIDAIATLNGVNYTIGCPCDYAVALCYFEEEGQLVPIELDDPLMDDVFPVAEGIIEDEFGEELVLLRTPQTLTLIGELDDDMDDDEEDEGMDDDEDQADTEEEVEILVSFEEEGREYHLVRLLDPILLVGKVSVIWKSVIY